MGLSNCSERRVSSGAPKSLPYLKSFPFSLRIFIASSYVILGKGGTIFSSIEKNLSFFQRFSAMPSTSHEKRATQLRFQKFLKIWKTHDVSFPKLQDFLKPELCSSFSGWMKETREKLKQFFPKALAFWV